MQSRVIVHLSSFATDVLRQNTAANSTGPSGRTGFSARSRPSLEVSREWQNTPSRKPWRSPYAHHQPQGQQSLRNCIRGGDLDHQSHASLTSSPPLSAHTTHSLPQFSFPTPLDLRLRLSLLRIGNPSLSTKIPAKFLHPVTDPLPFAYERRQPMRVVKRPCKCDQGDNSSNFVQEEKSDDMRDRRMAQRSNKSLQETRKPGLDSGNSRDGLMRGWIRYAIF